MITVELPPSPDIDTLRDQASDHAQVARRLEAFRMEVDDERLLYILGELIEVAWARTAVFQQTLLTMLGYD